MSRIWSGVVALVAVIAVTTLQATAQQSNPSGPRDAIERSTVARSAPARIDPPRILPGTPSAVFSTIQGNALTANNSALANAFVRLRNARIGQIVETQTTDKSGLFAFQSVDPGSYIVEIVDERQVSVMAASQMLNAGPGETLSVLVKLPSHGAPLAAIFGTSLATIGLVTAEAASAGVMATIITTRAAAAGIPAAEQTGAPTCELVR